MNLTSAVMLVNKAIRPVRVQYDPDIQKNNNPTLLFKTFDQTIVKDDLVVVPTNTRHGFTVAKVVEVGFAVDFNAADSWGWIADKFDKARYDAVLETEKKIVGRVAEANENKMRQELQAAMGLGSVDFSDLDIMAIASPPAPGAVHAPAPKPE